MSLIGCNFIDNDTPIVFAHRGMHLTFPDNTFESIEEASDYNIDALETDIQFSKEGVPIIHHDFGIDGQNFIDLTIPEIKLLLIDGKYEVPTLEEIVVLYKDKFQYINIDIKSSLGFNLNALYQLMVDYNCFDKFIFTSREYPILAQMKIKDPRFLLGTDGSENAEIIYQAIIGKYGFALVHYDQLTETDVALAQAKNIKLIPYTIETMAGYSTISKYNVFGVITNCPEAF